MNEARAKYLQDLGANPEQLRQIQEMDPSDGRYGVWCLKTLRDEKEYNLTLSDVRNWILEFDKIKNSPKMKAMGYSCDLNNYTLEKLEELLNKRSELKSNRQLAKDLDGAELVYDDGIWKVWRAFSSIAAVALATDAGWCTTRKETAKNYLGRNQLWVFQINDISYLQMHVDNEDEMTLLYRNNKSLSFGIYNKAFVHEVEVYMIARELAKTFSDMAIIVRALIPVEMRMDLLPPVEEMRPQCIMEFFQGTPVRIPELESKAFRLSNMHRYIFRFGCEDMIPNAVKGTSENAFLLCLRLGRRIPELENLIAFGMQEESYPSIRKSRGYEAGEIPYPDEAEEIAIPVGREMYKGRKKSIFDDGPDKGEPSCTLKEAPFREYQEMWIKYLDRFIDMTTYQFQNSHEATYWINFTEKEVYNPNLVSLLLKRFFSLERIDQYLKKYNQHHETFDKILELVGPIEAGRDMSEIKKGSGEYAMAAHGTPPPSGWNLISRTERFIPVQEDMPGQRLSLTGYNTVSAQSVAGIAR